VAERANVWPERLAPGWSRPADEGAWAGSQFNEFAPGRYEAYLEARNTCEWRPALRLDEHNAKYRAVRGRLNNGSARVQHTVDGAWPAAVCVLPAGPDVNGLPSQTWITRVGPIDFKNRFLSLASNGFDVYPAAPAGDVYMTASIEAVFNASSGRGLQYPPLHTHHAASRLQHVHGGDPRPSAAARATNDAAELLNRQFSGQAYGNHGPLAFLPLRQSMRHADFAGCVDGAKDDNACAFLAMPPGLGWPVPDGSATMSYSHCMPQPGLTLAPATADCLLCALCR